MVYTVTINPSLDYIVDVDDFKLGMTNRTSSELMLPGGKGINVSKVLTDLGVENTAIYFSAGFVGDEITRLIKEYGINAEEIRVPDGCSRINVKLRSYEGTEINGMGPKVTDEVLNSLYDRLEKLVEGDTLVLAGGIPAGMPETLYSDIASRLSGKGIRLVVDATKDLLRNVLEYKPFLIKPNNFELGEIFELELDGKTPESKRSIIRCANMLVAAGAQNVIVSMAEDGAIFVNEKGEEYIIPAPEGKLINAVGAGDSMVAGFMAGFLEKGDFLHAFKMGVAAGSASAYSEHLATKDEIMTLFASV